MIILFYNLSNICFLTSNATSLHCNKMPHFVFDFPAILSSRIKFHEIATTWVFPPWFSHACLSSRTAELDHWVTAYNLFEPRPLTPGDDETEERRGGFSHGKTHWPDAAHTGSAPGRFRVPVSHVFGNGAKIAAWTSSRPRSYHRLQPHSYSNQDQKVMWTVGHFGARDKDGEREEMVRKKSKERERERER